MTTAVQHRRGTTTEHSVFTGLEGELTIDTTKDTAVIHDGALQGGYPLAKENLANVNPTTLASIDGASTASDDQMVIYDTSVGVMKKISRAELNNAIVIDALDNVDINGGTIDGTVIGGASAAAGTFTTLTTSSTVTLNGGTANGVLYLDASKVATSGTALTFDGSLQVINAATPKLRFSDTGLVNDFGIDFYFPTVSASYGQITLNGATGGMRFVSGKSGSTGYYQAFELNGSEQMRLTSTGLGIGTSSPGAKLDVNGDARVGNATAGTNRRLSINGVVNKASRIAFQESGTDRWLIGNGAASENGNFEIYDATTGNNFILTRSGNLGLGVTPSAWGLSGSNKAIQLLGASLFSLNTQNGILGQNVYHNGTNFLYQTTDVASIYQQSVGNHIWFTAPSGTAGNAITFTQAMTLNASGNLGIGTSSPSFSGFSTDTTGLEIKSSNTFGALRLGGATGEFYVASGNSSQAYLWNTVNAGMIFGANNAERARITPRGNLLLGGTASPASATKSFALFNGTVPTGSVTDGCVLYTEDVSSSSELKVRDEAGNITTLSPHNFDLIPEGPSEDMAWSYYSERDGKRINVDMLKAIRLLEKLSGEQLVYESK